MTIEEGEDDLEEGAMGGDAADNLIDDVEAEEQSNKSSVNNSPSLEKPYSKEKKQPDQWTEQGYSRLFF